MGQGSRPVGPADSFLHAHRLEFDHPVSGEPMTFTAPLPRDLADVRRWALGGASRPSG